METQLNHYAQRNRSYLYIDGLKEIIAGVMLLLMALIFFTRSNAIPDSPLARTTSIAYDLLLTVGIVISIWFIQWQKERSTFPRTGKVVYPSMQGKELRMRLFMSVGGFALIALILIALFFTSPVFRGGLLHAQIWLPLLLSVFFGAGLIVTAKRDGIRRFYFLGSLSLMTGIGLWWSARVHALSASIRPSLLDDPFGPMSPELSVLFQGNMNQAFAEVAIFAGILGCAFLVSGIVTRLVYLRQNPLMMDEQS